MKIFLSPQQAEISNFKYTFEDDLVIVEKDGVKDEFDFTGLPDGVFEKFDKEGNLIVDTLLGENPIIKAKKKNGVLYLTLLNIIGENATEEERFPEWIDSSDYVFKENEEPEEVEDDETELEESEGN